MPPTASIPPEAIAVLQTFLDAGLKNDLPTMRTCLNRASLESGQFDGSSPQGVRYVLGDASMEGENVLVAVSAFPVDAPPGAPPAMQLSCLLVQEEGQWKFDLATTTQRMFSGGLEAALSQTAEALGTAMQGITETLGATMAQAFGESDSGAKPVDWLAAPLEILPEELLPLAEFTDIPKVAAALSGAARSPVLAMGAIKDLLYSLNSDERDVLVNWFDNQLFEGFGSIFSLLNTRMPFTNRLRAFRIEPAKYTDQRLLILDGSDLVYRMYLNTTDGYYSDEYFADLLPGVLAGLPPVIDATVVGHRLIHTDEEEANLDLYKDRVVPRYMRRICELLGKNITLKAQWEDIYNPREDTRQLYRWGLNRIYGAIALACRDAQRHEQLVKELTTIDLIFGSDVSQRFAHFKDGTLTVSIYYYSGEAGCFYERDLDRVLAGEEIRFVDPNPEPEGSEESGDKKDAEETAAEENAPAQSDAEKAQSLNDENFRSAVTSLKPNEPTWAMQLQMVFQRPIALILNFDSLGGKYELIQPFIHQGLTGTLEALTQIAFDPACKALAEVLREVHISGVAADRPVILRLAEGALAVAVPLQAGDARPPTPAILTALRALATQNPMQPLSIGVDAAPGTSQFLVFHPKEEKAASVDAAVPPFTGDPYAAATRFVADLEAAMREADLWPGPKPAGEIEVKGAFGCENMPFEHWLAWVLIARVQEIINDHAAFPGGSSLAPYAVKALDGANSSKIIQLLAAFDDMVNGLA